MLKFVSSALMVVFLTSASLASDMPQRQPVLEVSAPVAGKSPVARVGKSPVARVGKSPVARVGKSPVARVGKAPVYGKKSR